MTLLIARADYALPRTEAFFSHHGYLCYGLPVAHTLPALPSPLKTSLLIVTSAAAVPHLSAAEVDVGAIACVGASTAEALQKAGFTPQLVGATDGKGLAQDIQAHFTPQEAVHLAGDQATTGWYDALAQAGFTITTRLAYTTTYLETLPEAILEALAQKKITQILLFSPQGAAHTLKLIQAADVELPRAVCLSAQVGKAWQKGGSGLIIAAQPTLAGMLAALKREQTSGESIHAGKTHPGL